MLLLLSLSAHAQDNEFLQPKPEEHLEKIPHPKPGRDIIKIYCDVDTVHTDFGDVYRQRSYNEDLKIYIDRGGKNGKCAHFIFLLQNFFDFDLKAVQEHKAVTGLKDAEEYIGEIKQASPKFDVSIYEMELAFYKKYSEQHK